MLVLWQIQPEQSAAVLVINKTLIPKEELNEQPVFWVLKHNHLVRPNGVVYDFQKDFLGFKPKKDEKTYAYISLDKLSDDKVDYISDNLQASYYIGSNAPCYNANYGEMTFKDLLFLRKMKKDRKLIINEFNLIRTSWKKQLRMNFEAEFGIKSTGWIGGYFASLDSVKTDLPVWIIKKYMKQNKGKWPFVHDGIVFLHESGQVVVLDGKEDLNISQPLIRTLGYGRHYLKMNATIKYRQWFEIVNITDSLNHALSVFELRVSEKGRQMLMDKEIPMIFPAVVMQKTNINEYYYFCGNFSNNRIPSNSLYLTGGQHLAMMLDGRTENFFFYKFYRPLVSSIFNNYFQSPKKTFATNESTHK